MKKTKREFQLITNGTLRERINQTKNDIHNWFRKINEGEIVKIMVDFEN